jgi:hypothetical protein
MRLRSRRGDRGWRLGPGLRSDIQGQGIPFRSINRNILLGDGLQFGLSGRLDCRSGIFRYLLDAVSRWMRRRLQLSRFIVTPVFAG